MKRNFMLTPYLACLLLVSALCIPTTGIQNASAEVLESGFSTVF